MQSSNVDVDDSKYYEQTDRSSCTSSSEEGIFDDVEEEIDPVGWKIGRAVDQNREKRKIPSSRDYFLSVQRAIKRRKQKQEKLNQQLDPEQFDDHEDSIPHSGAMGPDNHDPVMKQVMADKSPGGKAGSNSTAATFKERKTCIDTPQSSALTDAVSDKSNELGNSRVRGSSEQKNDDSTTSTNHLRFDERNFFRMPTFEPQVKEEAFRRIYASLEAPLQALEKDGYEVYRQYVDYSNGEFTYNDRDQKKGFRDGKRWRGLFRKHKSKHSHQQRQRQREESIRNSLRNAIVNGDPREYQRKIFEIAKQRNTIVNLGTGAGKTLIALLLIREVWSLQGRTDKEKQQAEDIDAQIDTKKTKKKKTEPIEKRNEKKQTLFLVPSVALAIQQSLTLRANLPHLHIETACYTSPSSKRTRKTLARCDVIVATHGVIQDLLMHYGDMFRMDRFNLVVIDECHYAASGNHAYRHLMKKFYHPLEAEKRPRVLGLTASPLLNVKETHSDEQLSKMLDNLERALDSKMVSAAGLVAPQNSEVTAENTIASADSSTIGYLNRIIDERTFHYRGASMNRSIPSADNLDLLPSRYREFKQLEHIYKDLGPLVTSLYCAVLRRELSRNIFENESIIQFKRTVEQLQRIENFCSQEIKFLPNMGRNDKLLALEELIETLIEEKGGANTIGLVFVERRITAIALHCYFVWRNQQILDGNLRGASSDWKFAKEARKQTQKLDTFFELKTSSRGKDNQSDSENDQFDDSFDDPFRIFQRDEIQDENTMSNMEFVKGTNDTDTNQIPTSQFMDAENSSESELEDTEGEKSARDSLRRLGRVVVNPVALVRNPVHIFNSLSLAQKKFKESEKEEQVQNWVHRELNVRDVLNKLRRGDMNLLFATSVVEEGVDVQACSFVVAFDGLTNIKGYIQMKGRARKQDAKFFVLRDLNNNIRSKLELCVAQKMENRVQRCIETRMRIYAPKIQDIISSDDVCPQGVTGLAKEIAAIEARVYRVGDATVDVQSAKSLLNRYFLSIPLDPFVRYRKESLLAYMPCFESNRLILPVHLPTAIRTVVLPAKYDDVTRREKQKLMSLMACVRLHCYGLLNERLLPLTRKDMQSRIMEIALQELQKVESVHLDLDSFYDGQRQFAVYNISQKSHALSKYCETLRGEGHTLGLITTSAIKSIDPLQFYHSQFGKVEISLGEPMFVSCSQSQFDILQKTFVLLTNSRWSRKSRNIFYSMRTKDQYDAMIPPYLVGVLSPRGDLDWHFMAELVAEGNRSLEERTHAACDISSSIQLRKPRICCTSYNEFLSYVVFGPTGKSCGAEMPSEREVVETYCDYHRRVNSLELSSECPLFHAHRLWSLDSGLPTKPRSKGNSTETNSASFHSCDIPKQALVEQPLSNAHVASLCLFLPQVLYSVERHKKTEAFIKHCEVHIPTLGDCFRKMEFSKVTQALTSKSCFPEKNYDEWEWVGDAVLKLLQTDSILRSEKFKHFVKFLHEGDLSMLRSAMGTNERLKQICIHLRMEHYIMMEPLARGKWIPSPLQLVRTADTQAKDQKAQRLKVLADVIESILGVVYLEFGYHVTMKVGNELHVTFPWEEADPSVAFGEMGDIDNRELVNIVEKCTGHSKPFCRPKLLSEAFTHPSAIDASVPSYQRLEWIGDAVLCLCVREWLFRNIGERATLGDLVTSEGAIVSNETLGFLSMKFGLQEYLNHRDQSLPKRIESYCWNIQEGCGFWGGDPPKPIADMVEAILGAIHVDSGFESGQEATKQLMSSIFSVFRNSPSGGSSGLSTFLKTMKHPKKALQEMAGQLFDVMACSEHDFASSYDNDDEDESGNSTIVNDPIPKILHKDKWRNPARGVERGSDSCQVGFVSILGRPLVVVADESVTVARNRASSLVREAIERDSDMRRRIAGCQSNVESGLTLAYKLSQDGHKEHD